MPYVTQERRDQIENGPFELADATVGDINFLVSTLADEYLNAKGLSYTNVNNLIGALECVKLELYRRIAAPYEDKKIEENGDVYTCNLNQ